MEGGDGGRRGKEEEEESVGWWMYTRSEEEFPSVGLQNSGRGERCIGAAMVVTRVTMVVV